MSEATSRVLLVAILSATTLFGACSDGGSSTDPGADVPVATLVVQGTPTEPLLVDSTAQLFATAVNPSGATISNAHITWSTSNAALGTVSDGGLVTGRGPGRVTITASSGGQRASVDIGVFAGATIGTEGATIRAGTLGTLAVAPTTTPPSATVLLGPADSNAAPAAAMIVPGTALSILPEVWFADGALLTLGYDPAKLPAGMTEAGLQLYRRADDQWVPVDGGGVDAMAHQVHATIAPSGTYAIGFTAIDHLTITGSAAGGALFVGQTATLQVEAFDARNIRLAPRLVTWTTSAAGVATIDDQGLVTAVGAGTVTITATSEGTSATSTLQVLPRVTPDWSRSTEWTTYQGNAQHTGFVPVTADAGAFNERWVVTPFPGARLNPVATGGGAVYVSSSANKLAALDPATGSARWTTPAFGTDGVDTPAYGNGTVYLQTEGHGNSFLWAHDAATGALRFRSAYGNQWSSYFAPVIVDGAVYMAGGYYGGAYSFAATDGTQRWFRNLNQYDGWSPAVRDGLVYAYTGDYSPEVTVMDAATGEVRFSIPDPAFSWSGWTMNLAPALGDANDLLATNGGRLISFDLAGQRIGWEQPGNFTGSVAVADGNLYVVTNGQVEIRRESDGALVGPWVPPEGRVEGPVLVLNNLFFASTANATYAVDITTRRQVWSCPQGGALALSADGILYIAERSFGSGKGRLAAIALR